MNNSSGFRCDVDGQPDHLTPEHQLKQYATDTGYALFLDQSCQLTAPGEVPREIAADRRLIDGFASLKDVAWKRDPASQAWQPFWLSPQVHSRLSELAKEEPAPRFDPLCENALVLAGILQPDFADGRRDPRVVTLSQATEQVRQRGFAPVAGLIHPFHISALRRYFRRRIRTGKLPLGDCQSSRRYYAHNDSVARFFHSQLTAAVGAIFAVPVKPSYVYFASYQGGAFLEEHTDRDQCEFSISLCLDYSPEPKCQTPWPLQLHTPQGLTTVYQSIGDALLYRGCRVPHSRGVLAPSHTSSSIFFHYVPVDFNGPLD